MKITHPIFSLIVLLVQLSFRGFSQETVPSMLPEINFAKVNMYQGAIYTPPAARDGKNGIDGPSVQIIGPNGKIIGIR